MKRKHKILLIDDEVLLVEGLSIALKNRGFEVIEAFNGIVGIELAESEQPDLIILDVMMPILDGFKVCSCLKTSLKTKHIKVLLLTGSVGEEEDERRGRVLADAYVVKGPRFIELHEQIQQLLGIGSKIALADSH